MSGYNLLEITRSSARKLLLRLLNWIVHRVKNSPKLKRVALLLLVRFPVINIKLRKIYSINRYGYNLSAPELAADDGASFCVQRKLGVNSSQMTPLEKFFQNYGDDA